MGLMHVFIYFTKIEGSISISIHIAGTKHVLKHNTARTNGDILQTVYDSISACKSVILVSVTGVV